MNGDSDDQGYQLLSDDDIIQHVTQQQEDEEYDCEESDIPSAIEVKDILMNTEDYITQCLKHLTDKNTQRLIATYPTEHKQKHLLQLNKNYSLFMFS